MPLNIMGLWELRRWAIKPVFSFQALGSNNSAQMLIIYQGLAQQSMVSTVM